MTSVKDKIKRAAKNVIETMKALDESITYKEDAVIEVTGVSIDEVKQLYSEYQLELRQKQNEYITNLCERIKNEARSGSTEVYVMKCESKCLTEQYMKQLDNYFSSQGFDTQYNPSFLKISWKDGIKDTSKEVEI